MADIASTAAQIGRVYPDDDEILPVVLAEAAVAGQTLYQTASDTFGLSDGNGSGKQQFRGIALQDGSTGQVISMLKRGFVYGYTLSGNSDSVLYQSDTAGAFADAAGTMTVVCGRVYTLPNGTKVAYIDAQWAQIWT